MKVLVTRHEALVEYFANVGITFDKVFVIKKTNRLNYT